jgi:hypothetical protein
LLTVLAIFGVAFAGYFGSIWFAVRIRPSRWLVTVLWIAAVAYRLIILPTVPIQEIDVYRYIWDGEVAAQGISPYRYPPSSVLKAVTVVERQGEMPADETLRGLVHLVVGEPHLKTILKTIHFSDLPTVYPIVSQAVFATVAMATPHDASPMMRCVLMKAAVVAFDLATFACVFYLLRLTGKHVGWAIVYGWCPLVLKEFANSGHLDSIAVFLMTLTLAIAVRLILQHFTDGSRKTPWRGILLLAVVWSAAIGAKLFPILLLPLLGVLVVRYFGWLPAIVAGLVVCVLVTTMLWPMVGAKPTDGSAPSAGLTAFLGRWEMNDLIFLTVVENLRPQKHLSPRERPWFAVVPDEVSQAIVRPWSWLIGVEERAAPYLLARALTGLAFLLIAIALVWNLRPGNDGGSTGAETCAERWLRAAFLTVAWFWLLAPTQNPWYWCWTLPLAAFAKCRTWLVMSAVLMAYYLRFWLKCHAEQECVLGTPYDGPNFFHFVVVWIEYFPWYVSLAIESWWRRQRREDHGETPG